MSFIKNHKWWIEITGVGIQRGLCRLRTLRSNGSENKINLQNSVIFPRKGNPVFIFWKKNYIFTPDMFLTLTFEIQKIYFNTLWIIVICIQISRWMIDEPFARRWFGFVSIILRVGVPSTRVKSIMLNCFRPKTSIIFII